MLTFQKIVAPLGIFVSIVLCTNLFLINGQMNHFHTLWFGIFTIFMALMYVVSFFWAMKMSSTVNRSQELGADQTDCHFTRFMHFISLILTVIFMIYFFLYEYAQTDMKNEFKANNDERQIANYTQYLAAKDNWVYFLSIVNIIFGAFTIICTYALSGSFVSSRLMIYLIGIVLMWACYNLISNLQDVKSIFKGQSYHIEHYVFDISYGTAIASIIFLVFTILANLRILKLAYLILGTLLLICIAIQIPAAGNVFRTYNAVNAYYEKNCIPEQAKIHASYLEGKLSCPFKYIYQTQQNCPSEDPVNCLTQFNTCEKEKLAVVWEDSIINLPSSSPTFGCINTKCCGKVSNIYARTLLLLGKSILYYLFFTFIIGSFCLQLSAKPKGDKTLQPTLQLAVLILFAIVVISGFFYVTLQKQMSIQQKPKFMADSTTFADVLQPNKVLQHYPDKGDCVNLAMTIKAHSTSFHVINNPAAPVTSISNLDELLAQSNIATDNQCGSNVACANPGYIFTIWEKKQIPPGAMPIPGPPAPQCLPYFFYPNSQGDQDYAQFRFLDHKTAGMMTNKKIGDTPDFQKGSIFGLIGKKNAIEDVLLNHLKICNYNEAACLSSNDLLIRVIKVDLKNYDFKQEEGAASFIQLDEKLKQISHKRAPNRHLTYDINAVSLHKFLKIQAFDITSRQALEGVNLLVYNAHRPSGATGIDVYDPTCSNLARNPENDRDNLVYQGTTSASGAIGWEVFFNHASTDFHQFIVYATKEGYHSNCRYFSFNYDNFDQLYAHPLDIAIAPLLKADQARIVLEWNSDFDAKSAASA